MHISANYLHTCETLNLHASVLKGQEATFRVHEWSANPKHMQNAAHNSYCYRMSYVVDGQGYYFERNISSPLFKGTIFCSRPGHWRKIQSHHGMSILSVIFEIVHHESSETYIRKFNNLNRQCIRTNADNTLTGNIWMSLWTQVEQLQSQMNPKVTASLAYSLIASIPQLFDEMGSEPVHVDKTNNPSLLFQKVCSFINSNLAQPLKLQDVARALYISGRHLSRLFTEEIGQTFTEYIRIQRIKQATRLLIETTMTIEQISQETGFSSAFYFSKVFTTEMGMPPGKFRKVSSIPAYMDEKQKEKQPTTILEQ